MHQRAISFPETTERLYRWAAALAAITVLYNLAEGFVSVGFGVEDGSLSLAGFGLDSFVEVISGLGVWHMVRRIRQGGGASPDRHERRALRITGTAFFILTAGLLVTALLDIYTSHRPEATTWGIIVAAISIVTMSALIHFKENVGRRLGSQAIVADARCTRTCLTLSVVLLAASIGYELTGIGGIDTLGAVGIAVLAWREGRESFAKARGDGGSCSCASDRH